MDETESSWLSVRISEIDGDGADARALSRVLLALSNTMLAGARFILGERRPRSGAPSLAETQLASLTVTSITPGSIVMGFSRPQGLPPGAGAPDSASSPTPEDVASLVLDSIESVSRGKGVPPGAGSLWRTARQFIEAAGRVGGSCDLHVRDGSGTIRRVNVAVRDLPLPATASSDERDVSIFGHVFMADVETGRLRLRIKLPNDSDVTIETVPELRDSLPELLDQPVLLTVTEQLRDGIVVSRTVSEARVLPLGLAGAEHPPHSLAELALAQGLIDQPAPDYVALASATWPQLEDVEQSLGITKRLRKATA